MIERVISGGQTGVDRGALEAALEAGVDTGGWCPAGRRAEDGVIPSRYRLRETRSAEYVERTKANVRDSDGTLILAPSPHITGGTAATKRFAQSQRRPYLIAVIGNGAAEDELAPVLDWLEEESIATLNVAGPRESGAPGIQAAAEAFMRALLSVRQPRLDAE